MDSKRYCGIVFIGAGSSWAYAATPVKAAQDAARIARQDWKVKDGQRLGVLVYDLEGHDGWYAVGCQVHATPSKKKLEPVLITAIEVEAPYCKVTFEAIGIKKPVPVRRCNCAECVAAR